MKNLTWVVLVFFLLILNISNIGLLTLLIAEVRLEH